MAEPTYRCLERILERISRIGETDEEVELQRGDDRRWLVSQALWAIESERVSASYAHLDERPPGLR